jgi:hypothetical protein
MTTTTRQAFGTSAAHRRAALTVIRRLLDGWTPDTGTNGQLYWWNAATTTDLDMTTAEAEWLLRADPYTCPICGHRFPARPGKRYCSRDCQLAARRTTRDPLA